MTFLTFLKTFLQYSRFRPPFLRLRGPDVRSARASFHMARLLRTVPSSHHSAWSSVRTFAASEVVEELGLSGLGASFAKLNQYQSSSNFLPSGSKSLLWYTTPTAFAASLAFGTCGPFEAFAAHFGPSLGPVRPFAAWRLWQWLWSAPRRHLFGSHGAGSKECQDTFLAYKSKS